MGKQVVAFNKRARREYHIVEKFEAGVALLGAEVKSVRGGQVNFKDAYVFISKDMQAWIEGLHIGVYKYAAAHWDHSPTRRRRLLLHRRQIEKLYGRMSEKGLTMVPLAVYIQNKKWIKIELGLARGKKLYDKRQDIAKRDQEREIRRAMKERY